MYYNVIKHSGHLGTLGKCRKHSPAARVLYISLVFSNARRVLSQCNTRLRLLYLLTLWHLKKLFPLSIEKLTILAGQVTIWAKILLMPCGFCIGVLLLSKMMSSSPCVRMWPLLFKVPVIYKYIYWFLVWLLGILVILCYILSLVDVSEGSMS